MDTLIVVMLMGVLAMVAVFCAYAVGVSVGFDEGVQAARDDRRPEISPAILATLNRLADRRVATSKYGALYIGADLGDGRIDTISLLYDCGTHHRDRPWSVDAYLDFETGCTDEGWSTEVCYATLREALGRLEAEVLETERVEA